MSVCRGLSDASSRIMVKVEGGAVLEGKTGVSRIYSEYAGRETFTVEALKRKRLAGTG